MESINARPALAPRAAPCNLLILHRTKAEASTKPRVVSCRARNDEEAGRRVDRRDVLLGLGGAAASLATRRRGDALAAPIQAPDLANCQPPTGLPDTAAGLNCCPTFSAGTRVVDFKLPPASSPLRVRPAAQLVDKAYLAKYERAVSLMKQLPDSDPRSFAQQWRVHCAYCDGAYDQIGFPDLEIQVHNSWLFFPWHRFYLYFHERILGKLIGDDKFALPYWNWDAPGGMELPAIYANKSSPLYDEKRNPAHQPPFLVDLDFSETDPNIPRDQKIDLNLRIMYRQMVSGAKKTRLFMGQPYRAGDQPDPGAGSLENVPHGPVHVWTGDPAQPGGEDMGTFYSAARDPIFFAHHGNIDRLWHVWRGLRPGNTNFTEPDWLNASFLFYDEEARPVRVRVRDCLDASALRYTYQNVALPWLDARPSPRAAVTPAPPEGALPATLNQTVRVAVTRPKTSRSRAAKNAEEEVLVVEGIQIADHSKYIKFDVYVNMPEGGVDGAGAGCCAGSVALTPHGIRPHKKKGAMKTVARFGISDLLDTIGADGDKTIIVSIVPRCGGELVNVAGVSIDYAK